MPLIQEFADSLLRYNIQLFNKDGTIRPLINIIDELTWVWELLTDKDKIHIANIFGKCMQFEIPTSEILPQPPELTPKIVRQITIDDILCDYDKRGLK